MLFFSVCSLQWGIYYQETYLWEYYCLLYLLQFLEERKNKVSGPGFLRKWSTKAFLGGTTLELQGGGGKGRIEAGKITGNDVLPSWLELPKQTLPLLSDVDHHAGKHCGYHLLPLTAQNSTGWCTKYSAVWGGVTCPISSLWERQVRSFCVCLSS